jgi:hypothetical protein
MHTIYVIAGGFALLAMCLLAAKLTAGTAPAFARAALVFLPLWLIGAAINMWIGVAKAGYSVREELPIFLVIFAVPAVVAVLVWMRYRRRH